MHGVLYRVFHKKRTEINLSAFRQSCMQNFQAVPILSAFQNYPKFHLFRVAYYLSLTRMFNPLPDAFTTKL